MTLAAGASDLNQDFGFLGTGTLGRVIFRDDNGNEVPDPGEGLPGVTVEVTWVGSDAVWATADDHKITVTTDSAGAWVVGNLPAGEYEIKVMSSTLPNGAQNTVDPDGVMDGTSRVMLAVGATDLLQNFGYVVPQDSTGTGATAPIAFTGTAIIQRWLLIGACLIGSGAVLVLTARRRRARVA